MNALARYLRSSTFRLAVVYLLLFEGSVCVVLGFVYWTTAMHLEAGADAAIDRELRSLTARYRGGGLASFSRVLEDRVARSPRGPYIYLFATAGRRALAGNVSGWPDAAPAPDGWVEFPLWAAREPDDTPHLARARVSVLPGGLLLLVGRDMHEIDRACRRIRVALVWSVGLTLILAVFGAFAMGRGTMRRIDAINRASREIMRGDLARRIPTRGTRDDFDQLAEQLNAMLDRIQELMDGIRRVTDDIAHDLKTPLTRLRTRLEELRDSGGLGSDSAGSVEAAIGESDRLLATFAALLRIARVESQGSREGFTALDLGALAGDAVDLYEPYAHESGREIVFRGAGRELRATGDRDLLFQALSNLVDNALRHGEGRVVVEAGMAAAPGGGLRARIVVRDEGPGVPEGDRERVLRRFVRLEASRNTTGNGLGLALVEAVAVLHGGSVELGENEASRGGVGLRATLLLPVGEPPPASRGERPQGIESAFPRRMDVGHAGG